MTNLQVLKRGLEAFETLKDKGLDKTILKSIKLALVEGLEQYEYNKRSNKKIKRLEKIIKIGGEIRCLK